jgi:DNA excision repair protein ERCC-3
MVGSVPWELVWCAKEALFDLIFLIFFCFQPNSVKLFTSGVKETLPPASEACIVVTTYSMVCHGGRRSASGEMMIKSVSGREWGLMILDEVHVAPADMFQNVVKLVNAHCKLGLTATLVREDNKIKDLSFLVGPKLYEANWIDLTNDGYLAKVQCVEVWCPMTKEFYAEYIRRTSAGGGGSRLQRLLYILNPTKFRVCEYLVNHHTKRGDKIIIFSDDVPALVLYCEALSSKTKTIPYIYGGTKENDRRDYLNVFKTRSELNCIGLSKVGDTALDIPEANVIIQVSSHFGGRRQEAQRLGRILRPKPNPTGGFNAFFYTLVSTDTREMYFSSKRQQYLVDQGYTFKVVQDLAPVADRESLLLNSVTKELDLLAKLIAFNYDSYDAVEDRELAREEQGEVEFEDEQGQGQAQGLGQDALGGGGGGGGGGDVRRKTGKLSAMSGAGSSTYAEYDAY